MINITIVKIKQNILTIEATGHSGYAEQGSDIVCASISTLLQHLINGITEVVNVKADYVIDEEIPHLSITLPKELDNEKMKQCQILMKSVEQSIKQVAYGYKKFIKIKEKQYD